MEGGDLTPQERIAQLAEASGAQVPLVSTPSPAPSSGRASVPGADFTLNALWRKLNDRLYGDGQGYDRRRLMDLEIRLAAGVIARCLGAGWSVVASENRGLEIIHAQGFGFSLRRCWRDNERLEAAPLHRAKRNEPADITMSAKRTLGAIAADIERRLIDRGLRAAFEEQQRNQAARKATRQQRCKTIERIAQAWGGNISPKPSNCEYPTGRFPGGVVEYTYSDKIQIKFTASADVAEAMGKAARAL